MLPGGESFEVAILPSAMMDIVRGRYFYDQFEFGLGQRFRDISSKMTHGKRRASFVNSIAGCCDRFVMKKGKK